jgi:hypothetical protein
MSSVRLQVQSAAWQHYPEVLVDAFRALLNPFLEVLGDGGAFVT